MQMMEKFHQVAKGQVTCSHLIKRKSFQYQSVNTNVMFNAPHYRLVT